tara:strand:+ start:213 stop:434 length:222 start_codon:yes stop_codon:yes gene_type:complete
MLALSRKINERVVIGDPNDPIGTVTVVAVEGNDKVLLSFDFPREISINRAEIAESKTREMEEVNREKYNRTTP